MSKTLTLCFQELRLSCERDKTAAGEWLVLLVRDGLARFERGVAAKTTKFDYLAVQRNRVMRVLSPCLREPERRET